MTKLKAFADEKFNVATMMISVFDRIENRVGKGENALPAFSPFPTMFSKDLSFRVIKSPDCLVESIYPRGCTDK